MANTLTSIVIAIRELSYDRFPIPVFVLKARTGKYITNDSTAFKILPAPGADTPDKTITYNPDSANFSLQELTEDLVTNDWPVAYTGYYSATDKVGSLLKYADKPLSQNLTFLRRFFLSDEKIQDIIVDYFNKVLCMESVTLATLATDIVDLKPITIRHLALWCAITLVNQRRVAEIAATQFSGNFTDGTGGIAGSGSSTGDSIQVSIGSVFSITDDLSPTSDYFQDDFNRVGSDNVLGDKQSFWFKLYLHLRDMLEREFGDFQFRGDNVIVGNINLTKDLNFLTYFDSYPYTLSPYTRGIFDN